MAKQKELTCLICNQEFNTSNDLDAHLLVESISITHNLCCVNPNSRALSKIREANKQLKSPKSENLEREELENLVNIMKHVPYIYTCNTRIPIAKE